MSIHINESKLSESGKAKMKRGRAGGATNPLESKDFQLFKDFQAYSNDLKVHVLLGELLDSLEEDYLATQICWVEENLPDYPESALKVYRRMARKLCEIESKLDEVEEKAEKALDDLYYHISQS